MAYVRQKWWIPKRRQTVKGVLRICKICQKYQGKSYSPTYAPPLPQFRTNISEPYSTTGMDFTGALKIKREAIEVAGTYIVLFTCATTRAIHLKLMSNLTNQNFLNAFRQFTSRQGLPQLILSDDSTTLLLPMTSRKLFKTLR